MTKAPAVTVETSMRPEIGARAGAVQLHARGVERGAGHGHVGLGLPQRAGAVVGALAAERVGLEQLGVALGAGAGDGHLGLGLLQIGRGARALGLVAGGIELVERLAGAHRRAFLEEPLLDDAADLRADLGDLARRQAARQLQRQRRVLRRDDDHAHLGRRGRGGGGLLLAAAGGQDSREDGRKGDQQGQRGGTRHRRARTGRPRAGCQNLRHGGGCWPTNVETP
nr:hypothetical protein [Mitsuaria sp. TWR114]